MNSSPKLRTLLVRFENELLPWKIRAFRGAIIEKVGRDNILFNHHKGDYSYLYQYPLIQYKSIQKKPAILCLGSGVDEINKLLSKDDGTINLRGAVFGLSVGKVDISEITLSVLDKSFAYRISSWLALNSKNYSTYKTFTTRIAKCQFLERLLTANILSFAKGVEWRIERKVEVRIYEISNERPVHFKEIELQCFDVVFTSNIQLPNYIGLGKGASHGHGMIETMY